MNSFPCLPHVHRSPSSFHHWEPLPTSIFLIHLITISFLIVSSSVMTSIHLSCPLGQKAEISQFMENKRGKKYLRQIWFQKLLFTRKLEKLEKRPAYFERRKKARGIFSQKLELVHRSFTIWVDGQNHSGSVMGCSGAHAPWGAAALKAPSAERQLSACFDLDQPSPREKVPISTRSAVKEITEQLRCQSTMRAQCTVNALGLLYYQCAQQKPWLGFFYRCEATHLVTLINILWQWIVSSC